MNRIEFVSSVSLLISIIHQPGDPYRFMPVTWFFWVKADPCKLTLFASVTSLLEGEPDNLRYTVVIMKDDQTTETIIESTDAAKLAAKADEALKEEGKPCKTLIFDLDGTMYRGTQVLEGGIWAVDFCHEHGIPYLFLTNNATRTREQNVQHMVDMGYRHIHADQFFNSAMSAVMYAKEHYESTRAFYIGEAGMKQALEENGFEITEENPGLVFVGLDAHANYPLYCKALNYLLDGAVLVGTNSDRRLPKGNRFEVGNGAVIAMLEYASGVQSAKIGKPYRPILDLCLQYFGLKPDDVILVGDNLETDIALGYNNQVETVFVQTGVHTKKDAEWLKIYPDHTVRDLRELDLINLTTV